MTTKKESYIGKIGIICDSNAMCFEVNITGYKNAFGHEQWYVEPVAGTGQRWVRALTLKK